MNEGEQILKCRDDKEPVVLVASGAGETFQLAPNCTSSWLKKDEVAGPATIRSRIEPWLTALFQSEHFAVLFGSGLTHAVHFMATAKTLPGMSTVTFPAFDAEIKAEAKRSAAAASRAEGNIEDQFRAANELLRGIQILASHDKSMKGQADLLQNGLAKALESFAASILAGEASLITADAQKRETAFNYLVSFLMSFASRSGTRGRVQVFTTNYDRYIEAGAEVAGLHLLDRFVGSLAPLFRSSRLDIDIHYNPPGIRGEPRYLEGVAKFTKLHGSLDWVSVEGNIRRIGLPFGVTDIAPYLRVPGLEGVDAHELMIFPNSAKDRETAAYPYVDLFRDFASACCRPNNTLVAFGYSFGDEHINRVIEDMLTIPSTHLVVISKSDPLERIMKMFGRSGRHAQITLLLGTHLGDFAALVDNYLPKPAIDRTTFRMSELLQSRFQAGHKETSPDGDSKGEGANS